MDDYSERSAAISKARGAAIKEWQEQGTAEAEADAAYRKAKAVALLQYRADGKAQDESVILAEADASADRLARDIAGVMKVVAREKISLLERNAATLKEASQREIALVRSTDRGGPA